MTTEIRCSICERNPNSISVHYCPKTCHIIEGGHPCGRCAVNMISEGEPMNNEATPATRAQRCTGKYSDGAPCEARATIAVRSQPFERRSTRFQYRQTCPAHIGQTIFAALNDYTDAHVVASVIHYRPEFPITKVESV